ncbi:MAG: HIT domain-containing protein [Sulfuricaulis sp.]
MDSYKIVANVGSAAGQSIFHAPIHIIPRYQGLSRIPVSVRDVIARNAHYTR